MSDTALCATVPDMDNPVQAEKVDSNAAVEAVLEQYEGLKLATEEIDEFFVWPEEARPNIVHDKFDIELPVIDLSPVLKLERLRKEIAQLEGQVKLRSRIEEEMTACEAAKADVARAIGTACETYGFFQIVNHGFPLELVEQLTESFRHMFDQPLEEKMKISQEFQGINLPKPGYKAMKRSNTIKKTNKSHIWNEAFDLESPELLYPGRMEELSKTLWPEASENSKQSLQLRYTAEEYGKQSSRLSLLVVRLMAASLGLPERSMDSLNGSSQDGQIYARLRVNHYPVCAQPELTWGIHGHTDPNIITVLHQDAVGGLQICFNDGTWHGVRPIPGALVVNVGDFLQAWTNGRFLSAEHRVVANNKNRRFSIGYFTYPQMETVISPRPELVDAEHPLLYKPFTMSQYLPELFKLGPGKRGQILSQAFVADTQA